MANSTFIDDLEAITDEVSAWAVDVIKEVVTNLAPDGRGYGQEKIRLDKKLEDYRKLRNDLDACKAWINTKAIEIQNTLTNSGVPADTVGAINPVAIASALIIKYSSDMEAELEKRMI